MSLPVGLSDGLSGEGPVLIMLKLWEAMIRPAMVFGDSFILQLMSLFGAMTVSYYYIFSITYPDILIQTCHLTPARTGPTFIASTVGLIADTLVCSSVIDGIYMRLRAANDGVALPEFTGGYVSSRLQAKMHSYTKDWRLEETEAPWQTPVLYSPCFSNRSESRRRMAEPYWDDRSPLITLAASTQLPLGGVRGGDELSYTVMTLT
ncbi:MFS general substrate transporter [Apiospora saccharicola]|uniref:MFS general substrate transporter n=1 Tax=Apiospora saccharicola TaxID=335842 RepID=A0ABR1V9I7_9PEZI